jgi:hypothetical protein
VSPSSHPPEITDLARGQLNDDDELVIQLVRPRMPAIEKTLRPSKQRHGEGCIDLRGCHSGSAAGWVHKRRRTSGNRQPRWRCQRVVLASHIQLNQLVVS